MLPSAHFRHALLIVSLLAICPSRGVAQTRARFELNADTALLDERVTIVVAGLPPGQTVTVRARGAAGVPVSSTAVFTSDNHGRVDVSRMAPSAGSYTGVESMGLFWSARPDRVAPGPVLSGRPNATIPPPSRWELLAEIGGNVVAADTVWRRSVSANVRVRQLQERGLVGVFYEPADTGSHATIVVLGGSNGGVPPAAAIPGGVASRGYAVLSLGYFGVAGLPRTLSMIPLEYFRTAIDWLAEQPSVDSTRIGVVGISRGGELALLLAARDSRIRTVVAYVPSHVVWGGCCDSTAGAAWTFEGKPVPRMPYHASPRDRASAERAVIPVERISGPVLLISGREDDLWPSSHMSEEVITRLKRHRFPFPYAHLAYDGAGHRIGRPFNPIVRPRGNPSGPDAQGGGTVAATARASGESWPEMLKFLDRHLGKENRP